MSRSKELKLLHVKSQKIFWNRIKTLGPRKANNISMKVRVNNVLEYNLQEGLQKWHDYFNTLLNKINVTAFGSDFYSETLGHKTLIELNILGEHYISNDFINSAITKYEVYHTVKNLKGKKTKRFDSIPSEVLKEDIIILILCRSLQLLLRPHLDSIYMEKSNYYTYSKEGK